MKLVLATRRPRTRTFNENEARDVPLLGDARLVRLLSLRHLARAAATVRRLAAHHGLRLAFGATQGDA